MQQKLKHLEFIQGVINRLAAPLQSCEHALVEARRISLSVCVLAAFSVSLLYEEADRRSRLDDVRFYDEALSLMGDRSVSVLQECNINQAGIAESKVLDAITEQLTAVNCAIPQTSTITGSVSSCEAKLYKVEVEDAVVGALTDRQTIPLSLVQGLYTLIEFRSGCFVGQGPRYALVGKFRHRNDRSEIGVMYDGVGQPTFLEHVMEPFYSSEAQFRDKLLRTARDVTGKYYKPGDHTAATLDLVLDTQDAPSFFGISFPKSLMVFGLPVILLALAFSFCHRARRVDLADAAWIVTHARGPVEVCGSFLWQLTMVSAPVSVFLAVIFDRSPSSELQGNVDVLMDQRYSEQQLSPLLDMWLLGAKNVYVTSMCLMSLTLILMGLYALLRRRRATVVCAEARQRSAEP